MTTTEHATPFRIGGVYFNGYGATVIVTADAGDGFGYTALTGCGTPLVRVRLLDGVCSDSMVGLNLHPGELHQVNGEWVPISESVPMPTRPTPLEVEMCQLAYEACKPDPNAPMIARDGPPKEKPVPQAPQDPQPRIAPVGLMVVHVASHRLGAGK